MYASPIALPTPTPIEQSHSESVRGLIREEIERNHGWIGFARYMELALYAPGLGYYSAGARKFGEAGDFVTAPELSPMFARCLARQCEEILSGVGGGDILEIGAGSGTLAAELLVELERRGTLPRHYLILELSADLRQRQRETLRARAPQLTSRLAWLERLPARPLTGLVIGNELLDALPVERFRMTAEAAHALGVGWRDGRPVEVERPADRLLAGALETLQAALGRRLQAGYESEINLGLPEWLRSLAACLGRGVMLFIDYGLPRREYYHPERRRGTLLCHYRHRAHADPFTHVGIQDITAWVDFSGVADAADAVGLTVAGYTTQAQFLIGTGLDEQIAAMAAGDLPAQVEVARQARILTLPGEMGEKFKVLALARDYGRPMRGFALRDLRSRL